MNKEIKEIKEISADVQVIKEMCYEQFQLVKSNRIKERVIIGISVAITIINFILLIGS